MGEAYVVHEGGAQDDELTDLHRSSHPPSEKDQLYTELRDKFSVPEEEIEGLLDEILAS